MRCAFLLLLCFSTAAPSPVLAQSLTFEVASVKKSGPNAQRGFSGGPGTREPLRYVATAATMKDLVAKAYGVAYFQISSGQSLSDTYDVNILVPEGTTVAQFQQMMQALLRDRFHLRTTVEKKDFAAFELVVGKGGSKLQPAGVAPLRIPDGYPVVQPGQATWIQSNRFVEGYPLSRLTAQQQPVSALAQLLSVSTPDGEPVVDQTGLTGKYDFLLEYTVDRAGPQPASPPPAASLFTAVREQLGLELVSKKLPFDHVIVEAFDRMPAEN